MVGERNVGLTAWAVGIKRAPRQTLTITRQNTQIASLKFCVRASGTCTTGWTSSKRGDLTGFSFSKAMQTKIDASLGRTWFSIPCGCPGATDVIDYMMSGPARTPRIIHLRKVRGSVY